MKVLIGCAALLLSSAASAQSPASRVVVLDTNAIEPGAWPEGQAWVVAELRASGYAVELVPSPVSAVTELDAALTAFTWRTGLVGAVAVSSDGTQGVARVRTQRFGLQLVQMQLADGTLSLNRLALTVVDRVGHVEIPVGQRRAQLPEGRPAPGPRVVTVSVGAGAVNASQGASWVWFSAAGSWLPWRPFGLEATIGAAPWSTQVHTGAGVAKLRAERGMAYVMFEALSRNRLSFALGLGGGACVVHGSALGDSGFVGREDTVSVASLGARARASLHSGDFLLSLAIEPGVLLPSVRLQQSSATLVSLGRPWLASSLELGWRL